MVRRRCQQRFDDLLSQLALALHHVGRCNGGLQVGIGRRLAENQSPVVIDDLLRLALLQQRAGQQGHDERLRLPEVERLGELGACAPGVAIVEQDLAQEKPGFTGPRILLQRVAQLDDGGLGVVLVEIAPGRSDQLLAGPAATTRHERHAETQAERRAE